MAEGKTVSFHAYHQPAVGAGHYTAKARILGQGAAAKADFSSPELTFFVAGPRFQLSPAVIHAVFPPRGSLGAHDNVLPHIELDRSTLPWERPSGHPGPALVPWLGLLLLQEEELADPSRVKVGSMPWTDLRDALGLEAEPGDQPDAGGKPFPPVPVLELEPAFFRSIAPTAVDLQWLTHVRAGGDAAPGPEEAAPGDAGQAVPQGTETTTNGAAAAAFERAVLVCNRMPKPAARAEVHLVSFERRFGADGTFDASRGASQEAGSTGWVRLLSLHSWSFACPDDEQYRLSAKAIEKASPVLGAVSIPEVDQEALVTGKEAFVDFVGKLGVTVSGDDQALLLSACHVPHETFHGLIEALDLGALRAPEDPPPAAVPDAAKPYFEAGGVPLAHGLRQGGKTVSWYHGPLTAATGLSRSLDWELPVHNADQLLLYDAATRMLDISYAAAWELGRLLSLSQPRISQLIARWKTANARAAALVEQQGFFAHIPFTDRAAEPHGGDAAAPSLERYFEDLGLLKGVPFHYLVPNERLLPRESLRYFHVDPAWIEALMDGAFSIGRVTELDRAREQAPRSPAAAAAPAAASGVLLRSDLVSGWPTLQVDGYADAHFHTRLEPLRFERLGPDVLLVLFEQVLQGLTIHLPAEGLHFGFDRPEGSMEDYFKRPKSLSDGTLQAGSCAITWRGGPEDRVFDPGAFALAILPTGGSGADSRDVRSGDFAIEMLQGVPRLEVGLHLTSGACHIVPTQRVTRGAIIRKEPTSQSPQVGVLEPDDRVTCLGAVPYWHEVLLEDGTHGYVHKGWTDTVEIQGHH